MVSLPHYQRDAMTIAHHEAGHAVLCKMIGLTVTTAEIKADGSGRVSIDYERSDQGEADRALGAMPRETVESAAIDLATMYMAGIMAELMYHGLSVDGCLWLSSSDSKKAEKVLRKVFNCVTPLGYCQQLASAMLAEHWSEVEELAKAIHDNQKIEFM